MNLVHIGCGPTRQPMSLCLFKHYGLSYFPFTSLHCVQLRRVLWLLHRLTQLVYSKNFYDSLIFSLNQWTIFSNKSDSNIKRLNFELSLSCSRFVRFMPFLTYAIFHTIFIISFYFGAFIVTAEWALILVSEYSALCLVNLSRSRVRLSPRRIFWWTPGSTSKKPLQRPTESDRLKSVRRRSR